MSENTLGSLIACLLALTICTAMICITIYQLRQTKTYSNVVTQTVSYPIGVNNARN